MEIAVIPNKFIRYFVSDDTLVYDWNVFICNTFLLFVFLLLQSHLISSLDKIYHYCLLKALISIDCPGCGITRSINLLLNGNFKGSLYLNPGGIFIFLFLISQICLRLLRILKLVNLNMVTDFTKKSNFFVVLILFLFWIYKLVN